MSDVDYRRAVTVGIDSSASTGAAVDWALEYASSRRVPVRLIAAAHSPRGSERTRAFVDDLVLLCRSTAPATEVVGTVVTEPLAPVLLVAAQDSALLVIGAPAARRRASALLGTVDMAVAWAECSVVVARSPRWPNPAAPVAAGLDGSDRDDAVLDAAFDLAGRCATPLVVVHARADAARAQPDSAALVAERLARWQRRYPHVPVRFRVAVDQPTPVLLTAARWAGLLVVGAPGPGGVTRAVTHAAACPVLVARASVALASPMLAGSAVDTVPPVGVG